ncbi:hypothetical protein ACF0H5_004651 [Mactra antiquata]
MCTNFLYRVLRPEENPQIGIYAQAPYSTRTISEHVSNGSHNKSKFISTSKSLDATIAFALKSRDRPVRIVRIDVGRLMNCGQWNQDPDVLLEHISVFNRFALNCAMRYREVLIIGYMPRHCSRMVAVIK